jgi:hypothetical protein
MKTIPFLLAILALARAGADAAKPHVVHIMADELGYYAAAHDDP